MLIDEIIHTMHRSAELTTQLVTSQLTGLVEGEHSGDVSLIRAKYEWDVAEKMNHAIRYLLDVREVERFRGARFRPGPFPPMIHDSVFLEFNGALKFDFIPWQRGEVVVTKRDEAPPEPQPLHQPPFDDPSRQGTVYRAVYIERALPPHRYYKWPGDQSIIRANWFEPPREAVPGVKTADNYAVSFCPSSWPKRFDAFDVIERDEAQHPGEKEFGERLFQMTVNLLYFLAAENVLRVKVRPEHFERYGKEMSGLPRSKKEYYVLPFQLPRYRYLHRGEEGTGTEVSVCFDVRGHFRHLTHERYERNKDGSVRVIWIGPHQKGVGKPYRPAVRRGSIDSLFLDYDKFIAGEEARLKRRRRKVA